MSAAGPTVHPEQPGDVSVRRPSREQSRWRNALDAAAIGVWCWNFSSNQVEWDSQCAHLFGLPETANLSFENFFLCLHCEDRAATREAAIDAVQNGRQYDMIHRVVWPDGSVHWLRCKGGTTVEDGATCLVGTATEVTWLKRMEDVVRLNERLAASAEQGHALAHEINNPLEILCNALYLLKLSSLTRSQQAVVNAAADAYQRTADITRALLSLTPRSTDVVCLDLAPCIDSVVAHYATQAAERGLQFTVQCESRSQLICVEADFRQVLSILLENAIENVGDSASISVRCHTARDWKHNRRGIRLVVADNGRGIPEPLRSSLFQPFTTSKARRGSGLGLFLCRAIVNRYGGHLQFCSSVKPGRSGTCFSVSMRSARTAQQNADSRVQRLFPMAM